MDEKLPACLMRGRRKKYTQTHENNLTSRLGRLCRRMQARSQEAHWGADWAGKGSHKIPCVGLFSAGPGLVHSPFTSPCAGRERAGGKRPQPIFLPPGSLSAKRALGTPLGRQGHGWSSGDQQKPAVPGEEAGVPTDPAGGQPRGKANMAAPMRGASKWLCPGAKPNEHTPTSPETRAEIRLATGAGRYCAGSLVFLPASEDRALAAGGRAGFLEGFFVLFFAIVF